MVLLRMLVQVVLIEAAVFTQSTLWMRRYSLIRRVAFFHVPQQLIVQVHFMLPSEQLKKTERFRNTVLNKEVRGDVFTIKWLTQTLQ